jgi:hypothetical protein
MSQPTLTIAENAQTNLRQAVAAVEKNLAGLTTPADQSGALEELRGSWRAFLVLLDLGAEPERRQCPFCSGPIRLNATRCVHCWKLSSPKA